MTSAAAEDSLRTLAWSAWDAAIVVDMVEIPPSQAQLIGRVAGSDAFDGGKTARWLTGLDAPTYRSVRDLRTGHVIHCVSDRTAAELTMDLGRGLSLLAWMSARRPLVWYWWDQPWVRELPADTVPTRDHINGGWAVPGVPEVHVYRREEAHKVLIHECIHALGLDVPPAAVRPVRAEFERILGRTLWPHLGEAFTELYAEWLWSIAGARSQTDAERRWAAQRACSARQAGQVWVRTADSTEAETTNVFAYYVLKWVLMEHTGAVLLAPDRSVGRWLAWWRVARPALESLAKTQASTEDSTLRLGMTCPL